MAKIELVNREEELSILEESIREDCELGKLISLSGISGVGKSSFFQLFKQKHETGTDPDFLCLEEKVLSIDTPISFFDRFFSNLELKIHPKKSVLKKFFKKYSKPLQFGADAVAKYSGIPMNPSIILQQKQADSYHELENRLLNMFSDFEKKFPGNKLVLLIDDLDKSDKIDDFISIIDDIAEKIPASINLIFTSIENELDVDIIIPLANFDEKAITKFAKKNLPSIDEDTIKTIGEKSGGYPTTLSWVWQNYNRDQNIASLIQRLPREGFLNKLQENFLSLLSDSEKEIIKTCAYLDLIDSKIMHAITGIEEQEIRDFFEELVNNSILIQVNYVELINKQVLDLFIIIETFQNLVETAYGKDVNLHKKIFQHYVNILFENVFPIKNIIIALLLLQMEYITSKSNQPISKIQTILGLEQNFYQKFQLISEIYAHFSLVQDKEKCREFALIQKELSDFFENPNDKEYHKKLSEINTLFAENKYSEAKKTFKELAQWVESCKKNRDAKPEEIERIANSLRAFGNIINNPSANVDEFFQAILGKEGQKQFKPLYSNNAFLLFVMIDNLQPLLTANNYDQTILVGQECLKKFDALNEKDFQEFYKMSDKKKSINQIKDLAYYTLNHNMGIAYYLKANEFLTKEKYKKNEVKNLLKKAIKHLVVSKDDPIRGQYYHHAKSQIDELL